MTTAAQMTSRRRFRATLAVAALGTALLSGCSEFSPQQTDYNYQAADGVNTTFGDLDLRGIVVVADAKDAPGAIVGQLVNTGSEDIKVSFAADGAAGGSVTVPRRGSLDLVKSDPVSLPKVAVEPGAMIQLGVTTSATGQNVVLVPVLPPSFYYEGITPSVAPTGSPSATASPATSG